MSAPSEKQKVKRYTIPDGEYPPMEMRVADKWGGYVTFNAADEFVLATDFDTLTRETADLRREVEGMRELLSEADEYLHHSPGDCWIALGEIKPCNCGLAEFDERRKAALTATRKGDTKA